jgi:hypothetical protein
MYVLEAIVDVKISSEKTVELEPEGFAHSEIPVGSGSQEPGLTSTAWIAGSGFHNYILEMEQLRC